MSFSNTKYITKKKSKLKVVMLFNHNSFFFSFNSEYYFMTFVKHTAGFEIKTKADAYKVINEQDKYVVSIWTFKEIEERGRQDKLTDELSIAMKKIIREDKLKSLENES